MMRALSARLRSLELKLPLLISGLLVLVIGGFSWAAYDEVRDVTLSAAREHLERVTKQLDASLRAGAPQRFAEVRQVADDPAVHAYLSHPNAARRAAARATLQAPRSRDSLNAAVELWDAAGERVLAAGYPPAPPDPSAVRALTASATAGGGTALG